MSICAAGVRNAHRVASRVELPVAELPAFLCPSLLRTAYTRPPVFRLQRQHGASLVSRRYHSTEPTSPVSNSQHIPLDISKKLPRQCPGCGAHTQFVDKEEAGYYTVTRTSLQAFLGGDAGSKEEAIISAALDNVSSVASDFGFRKQKRKCITSLWYYILMYTAKQVEHPFCDRCHDIIHHSSGASIHHPTPTSIQETILESPHKYNHIYHIIDAADFPMSVVPQLQKLLHASPQRSQNRRAKSEKYYHGKQIEMSFIITRSDLLAAKKEQVDAMMPYLRETLRDALGRSAKDMRLGNVKCVSAQRQWWTGGLKEEIFKNGGGSWMVGKVNVGKSRLLHEIFPKGKREVASVADGYKSIALETKTDEEVPKKSDVPNGLNEDVSLANLGESVAQDETSQLDFKSLLPPLPAEVAYPTMPIVSSLPGTTASPIRLSFGSGRGEVIDLPGLSRGDIEKHIDPAHRDSLVMKKRVEPDQQNLQPGQSLLLGGFLRITPTSDLTYLAYNFTPLHDHKTSTAKAIEVQMRGEEAKNVENIALPVAAEKTKLAGKFHLKWDVTKQRAGPLTNTTMVGLKADRLPFKVMAADLLIEGVGWVEIVAQVRRNREEYPEKAIDLGEEKRATSVTETEPQDGNSITKYTPLNSGNDRSTSISPPPVPSPNEKVHYSPLGTSPSTAAPASESVGQSDSPRATPPSITGLEWNPSTSKQEIIDPSWPTFEVYTPEGKFVATRRPMNAWMNVLERPKKAGVRPRKSMKGKKKEEKRARRGW